MTCRVCGSDLPKRHRCYCSKACYKVADNRRHHRMLYEREGLRERHLARLKAYHHIPETKPCEVCGKKGERHHDNYDRPLEVRWLCRTHHSEVHRRTA
jgi:endogenous inhibitor of DNA gyrase (YacG/DUF329 family)